MISHQPNDTAQGIVAAIVVVVLLLFCLWAINPDSWQFH